MIVGDSSVDVITGRNAGIHTCGVRYGFAPETFVQHPPDLLVDTLGELAALLNGATSGAPAPAPTRFAADSESVP